MTSLGSVGDKGGPKKLLGPPYSPEKHSRICYCFVRGKNHQKTNTFTSDRSNPSIHRQNPGPSAMLAGIAQRRADGILNPAEQSIREEILSGLLADKGGE